MKITINTTKYNNGIVPGSAKAAAIIPTWRKKRGEA